MKKNVFVFIIFLVIWSCSTSDDKNSSQNSGNNNETQTNDENNSQDWTIPFSEVVDGGPGKDGIPSIDNPVFVDANSTEANYLNNEDLVVGVVKEGEVKAYPHIILDWHEIVNDLVDNEAISISYCPLTGTAFGWKSEAEGQFTTFGVSGLLYNSNLILYDRNTDSNWSQLKLECVNGQLIGEEPSLVSIIETNWQTWKHHFPNTKVLSLDTGFTRNYGTYPYGSYKDNEFLLFPVSPLNSALPKKERVYAIIEDGSSKVYRFTNFQGGRILKENFSGNEFLIVGNENLLTSFKLTGDMISLDYNVEIIDNQIHFIDSQGSKWDITGKAVEGPRTGQILSPSKSVVSYWFAIAAFYPDPVIYSE